MKGLQMPVDIHSFCAPLQCSRVLSDAASHSLENPAQQQGSITNLYSTERGNFRLCSLSQSVSLLVDDRGQILMNRHHPGP
jgi:hypothetical protein